MDWNNLNPTMASWARLGGIAGAIVTFFLFGLGGGSGATGILLGGLKGLLGGGIGAGIFAGLAITIFAPEFVGKITGLVFVAVLSIGGLFLVNNYSPIFRSFTSQYDDVPIETVEVAPADLIFINDYGDRLVLEANNWRREANENEIVEYYRDTSAIYPDTRVVIQETSMNSDAEGIRDRLEARGVKNISISPVSPRNAVIR